MNEYSPIDNISTWLQVFSLLYSCGRWTILSGLLAVRWRWPSADVYAFTLDETTLDDVLLLETPSHDVTSTTASYWIQDWLVAAMIGAAEGVVLWLKYCFFTVNYYHWPPRKCGCCSSYWYIILWRPQFGDETAVGGSVRGGWYVITSLGRGGGGALSSGSATAGSAEADTHTAHLSWRPTPLYTLTERIIY